jgi:hypothetical protein
VAKQWNFVARQVPVPTGTTQSGDAGIEGRHPLTRTGADVVERRREYGKPATRFRFVEA